jgi:hypothetical protein
MEFIGKVVKHTQTQDQKNYSVIEFENKLNLNYRIFIPGWRLDIGTKVKLTIEGEQ